MNTMVRIVLALCLLVQPIAANAAVGGGSSVQADANKPRFGSIQYAHLLYDVISKSEGVNPELVSGQVPQVLGSQIDVYATDTYNRFAANNWNLDSKSWSVDSGGWFRTTTTTYLQIKGDNAFTGEHYDSGGQVIASQSGWGVLGIILAVVVVVGVTVGTGGSGTGAAAGAILI